MVSGEWVAAVFTFYFLLWSFYLIKKPPVETRGGETKTNCMMIAASYASFALMLPVADTMYCFTDAG